MAAFLKDTILVSEKCKTFKFLFDISKSYIYTIFFAYYSEPTVFLVFKTFKLVEAYSTNLIVALLLLTLPNMTPQTWLHCFPRYGSPLLQKGTLAPFSLLPKIAPLETQ